MTMGSNATERFFSWLKRFRRLAARYDTSARSFFGNAPFRFRLAAPSVLVRTA
jgi:transposase